MEKQNMESKKEPIDSFVLKDHRLLVTIDEIKLIGELAGLNLTNEKADKLCAGQIVKGTDRIPPLLIFRKVNKGDDKFDPRFIGEYVINMTTFKPTKKSPIQTLVPEELIAKIRKNYDLLYGPIVTYDIPASLKKELATETEQTNKTGGEYIKLLKKQNIYMILDTETTGLATTARIVEITWRICIEDTSKNGVELIQKSYLIKPNGFTIPPEVIKIHGITNEMASLGVPLSEMLTEFENDLKIITHIVAHNAQFDIGKLELEATLNKNTTLIEEMKKKKIICTYKNIKDGLKMSQANLFMHLFEKDMGIAHRSGDDTKNLRDIFFELRKKNLIDV